MLREVKGMVMLLIQLGSSAGILVLVASTVSGCSPAGAIEMGFRAEGASQDAQAEDLLKDLRLLIAETDDEAKKNLLLQVSVALADKDVLPPPDGLYLVATYSTPLSNNGDCSQSEKRMQGCDYNETTQLARLGDPRFGWVRYSNQDVFDDVSLKWAAFKDSQSNNFKWLFPITDDPGFPRSTTGYYWHVYPNKAVAERDLEINIRRPGTADSGLSWVVNYKLPFGNLYLRKASGGIADPYRRIVPANWERITWLLRYRSY